MKSIRKDLFICLDKHGEQTIDDLISRVGDYTRGQLSNNIQAARKEGLIISRRDDVTGGPAYKLTPSGKKRLVEIMAKASIGKDEEDVTLANEGEMPADKECCNAAKVVATTAGSQVDALNARIETLEEEIGKRNREIKTLTSELGHARIQVEGLTEQLMHGSEVVDVRDASFYAVFRPGRGLQRFKKIETAKAEAEVGARVDGQAELYAMVLVDVAKTGAVWAGSGRA